MQGIADLCARYPVEKKIIFTPSRQIGYNASNALLRKGTAWANLEFVSPTQHAHALCDPALLSEGKETVPFDLTAFVVLHLLNVEPALTRDLLGEDIRITSGTIASLERSIVAIRMSGGRPKATNARSSRQRALIKLLSRYEEYLQTHKLVDDAEVLSRALSHAELQPQFLDNNGSVVASFRSEAFTTLEAEYLNSISSKVIDLSANVNSQDDGAKVSIRYANGSRAESLGVVEEILERALPFDDVEIAYTSENPYLHDVANLATWVPDSMSFANGTPVQLSVPGQALAGYLKWVISGCRLPVLNNLLRSQTITLKRLPGVVIRPDFVAQQLVRWNAGDGLQELSRVVRMVNNEAGVSANTSTSQPTLFDNPGRTERAMSLKRAVDHLSGLVPQSDQVSIRVLAEHCIEFLNTLASMRSDRDSIAKESLLQRLENLKHHDIVVPTRQGYEIILRLLQIHKTSASVATEGKINVVPVEKAGISGRTHVFVLGMDDETYPGRDRDNYFTSLLDANEFPLTENSGRTERELAVRRLINTPDTELVLVSQRCDPADGSELHPSPVVRAYEQDGITIHYDRHGRTGIPIRPSFGLSSFAQSDDYPETMRMTYPWIAQGTHASTERQSSRLTHFDGVLDEATPELSLDKKANVVSASAMEKLSGCSYRYFLQRVLKVRVPEKPANEYSWLSSLQKGRLLHDLLFHYNEERRISTSNGEHRPARLMAILDRLIEQHTKENPPHNAAGFHADKQALVLAAEIFLSAEDERTDFEPYALELRFGFDDDKSSWSTGPLKITLGDDVALNMRGAIDRVDTNGTDYRIWDYKSGSLYNFDELPLAGDLRHLQWALYAFALEEILKARGEEPNIVESGYFFISEKGNGQIVSAPPPERTEIGKRIKPLLDLVSSGTFVHAHRERDECRFCDFNPVCGGESVLAHDVGNLEPVDERTVLAKTLTRKWLQE